MDEMSSQNGTVQPGAAEQVQQMVEQQGMMPQNTMQQPTEQQGTMCVDTLVYIEGAYILYDIRTS